MKTNHLSYDDLECELQNAVAELERLEAENHKLKEANTWIPVSERLPETTDEYWTTKQYLGGERWVGQDSFISEHGGFCTESEGEVVAWREIQDLWNEPYQGDV